MKPSDIHQKKRPTSIRRHPQIRPMFAGLRHFDRKRAELDVVLRDESGLEIPFESVNVSESGVFVSSRYLYDVGQVHCLMLRTRDGAHCVELTGQVVRVQLGEDSGMAYRFLPSERETFYSLAAMVAGL